jgi:hypothetical protein
MTISGLTSAWDALPRHRKRSLIRTVFVLSVNGAITGYEARRIGVKEALRPRFIWNMSRERQRLQYLRYTVRATASALQNHLNERDLAQRANAPAA